ncbi:MAG TPA: GNAT family N-acetyltransferase [Mucilaginibacter sp.]|jgi:GNAT superfamily N-acetyltransferase|nr:GNAT family N-acetyltransferase [Mucilaginibacter sp.]
MSLTTRLATFEDVDELQQLIAVSARALSDGYYSHAQTEGAIKYVFGVDSQLIQDGTYYVVETKDCLVACGGWSMRSTLFGGDQHKSDVDPLLNPATDAARIRAFFVHPDWARQGIGRMLIAHCEKAANHYGFTKMEIGSTLPGVPLYESMGYHQSKKINVPLPDGGHLPVVNMKKDLNLSRS